MNSKERHEARYQRRVAKRAAKRLETANKYANLLEIFSFDELNMLIFWKYFRLMNYIDLICYAK